MPPPPSAAVNQRARARTSSSHHALASGLRSEALTAALPPLLLMRLVESAVAPSGILRLTFFDIDGFLHGAKLAKARSDIRQL